MSVMVSVAVSQVGATELIFVNPGVKVKCQYYCNVLLSQRMLPAIKCVAKHCLFTKQYVACGEIGHFLCSVISQGQVVALDRWGVKWNQLSMTHRLTTNYAKNYCNRTLIVKVIVENVVTCFLGDTVYIVIFYCIRQNSLQLPISKVSSIIFILNE